MAYFSNSYVILKLETIISNIQKSVQNYFEVCGFCDSYGHHFVTHMVTICLVIVLFICKRYTKSEGKFSCIWNLYFSHSELNKDQNFELALFFSFSFLQICSISVHFISLQDMLNTAAFINNDVYQVNENCRSVQ